MKITKAIQSVAYHEAGHAVIAYEQHIEVNSTTIIPNERTKGCPGMASYGMTHDTNPLRGAHIDYDTSDKNRLRMERFVMVCLAGPASQEKYHPRGFRKYHASHDWDRAINLIRYFTGPTEKMNEEIGVYMRLLEIRTEQSIDIPHTWELITKLANALTEKEKLTSKQIKNIISV